VTSAPWLSARPSIHDRCPLDRTSARLSRCIASARRDIPMTEPATFTLWCVVVGLLLIAMTLGNSFIARLPLSAAMLYLVVGYAIGPAGVRLVDIDPLRNGIALERICEIAVLISLFTAGLS